MIDATESSDDAAELNPLPDPLRPAFEAVSAATDPRGKLEALKRAATDLAIPIRHGMLDIYEIEERLLDLANSHGLIAELTLGTLEGVIANAVRTPALAEKPIEHANGHEGGAWDEEAPSATSAGLIPAGGINEPDLIPAAPLVSPPT
jgi:hypothetical protein